MGCITGVNYGHFIGTVTEIQCDKNLDCRVPAHDGVYSDRHKMSVYTAQDFHPENGKV